MQAVVTKDSKILGQKNSVIKVSRGYYLNYLLPQGLAKILTPGMAKELKKWEEKRTATRKELFSKAEDFVKILGTTPLVFSAKAEGKKKGDSHTLYGSLTEKDIAQKINEDLHLPIEANQVEMAHIKTTGMHVVTVRLTDKHTVKVKVEVKAV